MPRLFRPTYKSIDPKTGEPSQRRSEKWYADYLDADDKRRRVPLSSDKSAAQAQLADIIRIVERQKAGIIEKIVDVLKQPVDKSVEEYRDHLESKGRAAKHVSETIRHIRKALAACECVVLGDLQRSGESLEDYLVARRQAGASHRTINADLTAVRSFCRWLVTKKRRLSMEPTIHLEKLDEELDRRRVRRPLTDDEAERLFRTTLESEVVFRGLSGQDRAMLYMVAQRSGFRRGELLSLAPRSFKLTDDPPTIRIKAKNAKGRKEDVLPLPAEVAKELSAYLKDLPRSKPIWPGTWWEDSAEMFRVDLAAAEIPILDEDGTVLDFHGQRTTYITGLARAGVSPTKAQKLARHSDINLTMRTYTHLQIEELASSVESLPSLRNGARLRTRNGGSRPAEDEELRIVVEAWASLSSDARRRIASIIQNEPREQAK
jgi:integrase